MTCQCGSGEPGTWKSADTVRRCFPPCTSWVTVPALTALPANGVLTSAANPEGAASSPAAKTIAITTPAPGGARTLCMACLLQGWSPVWRRYSLDTRGATVVRPQRSWGGSSGRRACPRTGVLDEPRGRRSAFGALPATRDQLRIRQACTDPIVNLCQTARG